MNIVLMTNTFSPHVGGVAKSVQAFTDEYRKRGHRVLVVAPEFPDMPEREEDVVRIPAIQNFNASDFSVVLPVPMGLTKILEEFEPDLIHAQHPFLLGMTALRVARKFAIPLVFTHHTLYEEYTHYVPGDSEALKNFVIELATHYANMADLVIAPSESIATLIQQRGVKTPVEVIPTGVYTDKFAAGDGERFRRDHGIAAGTFVVGHMGRLAEEKNLPFLAGAVLEFLKQDANTSFLVVGTGECKQAIRDMFAAQGMEERLVMAGTLEDQDLADALQAMNVFTFASRSETQGMVLTEAMAAGLPVVALEANGVREVVRDKVNGKLVTSMNGADFTLALKWLHQIGKAEMQSLIRGARETADDFSMARSAEKALRCFRKIRRHPDFQTQQEERKWEQVSARISAEWEIIKSLAAAGDKAITETMTD